MDNSYNMQCIPEAEWSKFNRASSTHQRSFRDGLNDGETMGQNPRVCVESKKIIDAPVVLVC